MRLSVIIPAKNEEECLRRTVDSLHAALNQAQISHEILVINDGSTDGTAGILNEVCDRVPNLKWIENRGKAGFGEAVKLGLQIFSGDAVLLYMADAAEPPEDIVRFYRALKENSVDSIFGTRFHPDAKVEGYPAVKMAMNRVAGLTIGRVFGMRTNDVTNSFKLFRRTAIQSAGPFISRGFAINTEIALKIQVRGVSYLVLPNHWKKRSSGTSKFHLATVALEYLVMLWHCLRFRSVSSKEIELRV